MKTLLVAMMLMQTASVLSAQTIQIRLRDKEGEGSKYSVEYTNDHLVVRGISDEVYKDLERCWIWGHVIIAANEIFRSEYPRYQNLDWASDLSLAARFPISNTLRARLPFYSDGDNDTIWDQFYNTDIAFAEKLDSAFERIYRERPSCRQLLQDRINNRYRKIMVLVEEYEERKKIWKAKQDDLHEQSIQSMYNGGSGDGR